MRAQIMAGMVTYNPDPYDLSKSVPALIGQVNQVVIVDNGSNNISSIRKVLEPFSSVLLICNKRNEGIARALNQIFSWGGTHGYRWVLTMDDDSEVPDGMVEKYGLAMRGAVGRIGIVCPLLRNRRDGTVFHSKRSNDECITSGSLTSMDAWKAIDGFDEWLFIDEVDFDFSRRMVRAGYQILECDSVLMPHQIGDSRTIHLLGKNPIIWNHSAFRQYYIQRNRLYVDWKLGTYKPLASLCNFLKDLVFVLIWEDDKSRKINAMVRGWKAGKAKIRAMRQNSRAR